MALSPFLYFKYLIVEDFAKTCLFKLVSKRGLLSLLKSIHYYRGTFSSELSLVILETISSYLLQIKDFVLFWAFLCSLFPFAIFFKKCGHYFLNSFPEQGMFHIKVKKTNNNNLEHS